VKGELEFGDPTRRTYLAAERTYLAWVRSGLAGFAVSLGVGRLLPSLVRGPSLPFVLLGIGFGLFGLLLIVFGSVRQRQVRRALEGGDFRAIDDRIVLALTVAGLALGLATLVLVAFA